jgi:hypothetical protein
MSRQRKVGIACLRPPLPSPALRFFLTLHMGLSHDAYLPGFKPQQLAAG